MFKNIFSFNGRIRRSEYAISFIFYFIGYYIIRAVVKSGPPESNPLLGLAIIPLAWIIWAQGAKRCHDLGRSGWWQIIPFYVLWMLFEDGDRNVNEYGHNPKYPMGVDPLTYEDGFYNNDTAMPFIAPIIASDIIADSSYMPDDSLSNDYDNNVPEDYNDNSADDDFNDDDTNNW